MKLNVFEIISSLGVVLLVLGLVSSDDAVDPEIKKLSNIADELHELLNVSPIISHASHQPFEEYKNWIGPENVGQITGVSVNTLGKPVIFHRGDRIWNSRSFDSQFQFREAFRGPIRQDTVLTLNPQSGLVESSWGADFFYLPHGLHIDVRGYVWLTDVAMHQVFKFKPDSLTPDLVLGEAFTPGSDYEHFCQPTSVAVAITGEIVVADGYCNSRIMIFHHSGKLIDIFPNPTDSVTLHVPHALAILPRGDICVADRENMRIICFPLNKNFQTIDEWSITDDPRLGKVFGIAARGNILYAVNGATSPPNLAIGYVINAKLGQIMYPFHPVSGIFVQPHAIAISPNGTELYVTEIGPNRIWKFNIPNYH